MKKKMTFAIIGGFCMIVLGTAFLCNEIYLGDYNTQAFSDELLAENGNSLYSNTEAETIDTNNATSHSNIVNIDVQYISQYPELPTGCEITSLTMVMNYYGFKVSKTQMASNYLEKENNGDFREVFVGDPFSVHGYGCYAKPIVNAANKYFTGNHLNAKAIDISGSDFDVLLAHIRAGVPVLVWNTMEMKPAYVSAHWMTDTGMVEWIAPEHCVVLIGYNEEEGTVRIADPMAGIVDRNMQTFRQRYYDMSAQAVYISVK